MRSSCEINLLYLIKPCPSAERHLAILPEHEPCTYSVFQCGNSSFNCLPAGSCAHTAGRNLHLTSQCNLNTRFPQILLTLQTTWFTSQLFRRHMTEVNKQMLLLLFQGWSTITYRLISSGVLQGCVLKLVEHKVFINGLEREWIGMWICLLEMFPSLQPQIT